MAANRNPGALAGATGASGIDLTIKPKHTEKPANVQDYIADREALRVAIAAYFDARGVDAAGLVVAGLQTLYREADDRLRAARRAVRR